MTDFIVASSKPWHRKAFEQFSAQRLGRWTYISTPTELEAALSENKQPRYVFFLHWNWKVPASIYERHECICFHMTDVPYGRGGSPLQNLILAGKNETQLTALRMVEEMDAGPVYAKRPMGLEGRAEDIYLRAGELCWEMIDWLIKEQPTPVPQVGTPTFFKRRRPAQSVLPKTGSTREMFDFIRMLDAPTYPVAFLEHGDFQLEFSQATFKDGELEARVIFRPRSVSHE